MWNDEILEEIHNFREEYAKSFNYDLKAICEDLRKKQDASGREIISTPVKQIGQKSNKSQLSLSRVMRCHQTIAVNIPPTLTLTVTHEQFAELAQANRDLQLERTATGELIIMPPTGSDTGNRNLDLEGQL